MTNAIDLLRTLGLSSGPAGNGATPPPVGGTSFSDLLSKATGGEFSTGLEVTLSQGANVELSSEQLQRLAKVADSAEAQGASRVLVLMDGHALTMDVGVRQITGTADMTGVVTGIDAVVVAPGNGASAAQPMIGPPRASMTNASLLDALASIVKQA